MSVGPEPSLSGALITWADSPVSAKADSGGDVASKLCDGGTVGAKKSGGGNNDTVGSFTCNAKAMNASSSAKTSSPPTENLSYFNAPGFGGISGGGSGDSGYHYDSGGYQDFGMGEDWYYISSSGDLFGSLPPGGIYLLGAGIPGSEPCLNPSSLGCVSPGTRIALYPDGCALAAELRVGDTVLARDEDGNPAGEEITQLTISKQPCAELELGDGRKLHCSLTHEIMVRCKDSIWGEKKRVSELSLGDQLLLQDDRLTQISAITRTEDRDVVRIALTGPRNIYLSNGVWSHNKSTAGWPV